MADFVKWCYKEIVLSTVIATVI